MATVVTPKLLLLDEHTAALDPRTAQAIMELTQRIIERGSDYNTDDRNINALA